MENDDDEILDSEHTNELDYSDIVSVQGERSEKPYQQMVYEKRKSEQSCDEVQRSKYERDQAVSS